MAEILISPVIKIDRKKNIATFIILRYPVKNIVNISTADVMLNNSRAQIISMQGAVVKSFTLKEGSQTIDLGGLSPGKYYIRTTRGNENFLLR
jgi:Secretion system C-terminal sorting domain